MAESGYATKTIRDTRRVLASAIRRAERDGLAGRQVALLADLPSGTRRQSGAMTLAEVGQLVGSGLTPWWRAFVTVGVMCGLRPGELARAAAAMDQIFGTGSAWLGLPPCCPPASALRVNRTR